MTGLLSATRTSMMITGRTHSLFHPANGHGRGRRQFCAASSPRDLLAFPIPHLSGAGFSDRLTDISATDIFDRADTRRENLSAQRYLLTSRQYSS
jgi:hypothetical protein